MIYTTQKPIGHGALFAAVVLVLLGIQQIGSAAGIDPAAKWAWSTNVGGISLKGGSGSTAYGVVTDFHQFQIYLPLVLRPSYGLSRRSQCLLNQKETRAESTMALPVLHYS